LKESRKIKSSRSLLEDNSGNDFVCVMTGALERQKAKVKKMKEKQKHADRRSIRMLRLGLG
jgi:hypothetical protein